MRDSQLGETREHLNSSAGSRLSGRACGGLQFYSSRDISVLASAPLAVFPPSDETSDGNFVSSVVTSVGLRIAAKKNRHKRFHVQLLPAFLYFSGVGGSPPLSP